MFFPWLYKSGSSVTCYMQKAMGVEFFNFLVARIFHVQLPGNGRDVIRIVQKAKCTCMKQYVFFLKKLIYFIIL